MRFLILILFLVFAVNAFSAPLLRTGALPMFANGERSLISQATLGPLCSSIRAIKNEPACNPALLGEDPLEEQPFSNTLIPGNAFGVNLFFGHDVDVLYKNRDLISGEDKAALAQSLMSETEAIRFEASTLLWWRGERASLSYQPMRVTYFSDVRNPTFPDLAVHALQEQSVQGQVGGFVNENLRLGVQLRYVDRKFVHEQFNFFDALPQLDQYLQVKKQSAFFVEPGLAYEFNHTEELKDWRPLLTLNLSQTGWLSQSYDEAPVTPILDSGFSVSAPVAVGELELGFNYRFTTTVSLERKFRFGGLYRLGFFQVQAGWDTDEWSLGAQASFQGLGIGMLYRQVELKDFADESELEESTLMEIRYTF